MKAVVYGRVSTKEQTKNLNLPAQRKACREYCEDHGWTVDRVFVECGESAKTAERTELNNLLEYCRENRGRIHVMVVYSLDRFARNNYGHYEVRAHLEERLVKLEERKARLVETVLAFTGHVVVNARRLWNEYEPRRKRHLQRVLFPEGPAFDSESLGAPVTCLFFSDLEDFQGEEPRMASPTGEIWNTVFAQLKSFNSLRDMSLAA